VRLNFSTIRNIWALFGVVWFIIFLLLVFAKEMMETVILVVLISLCAGLILSAFTILYLTYFAMQKVRRRVRKQLAYSVLLKSSQEDPNERKEGA